MNELNNPRYYYNRELSWLLFNERILSEARDKTNPLFERLKFLSITASNLDEFFMIRVASLRDMVISWATVEPLFFADLNINIRAHIIPINV